MPLLIQCSEALHPLQVTSPSCGVYSIDT